MGKTLKYREGLDEFLKMLKGRGPRRRRTRRPRGRSAFEQHVVEHAKTHNCPCGGRCGCGKR